MSSSESNEAMNSSNFHVSTDEDSYSNEYYPVYPRLGSPRHSLLSPSIVSLMTIMFSAGILVGGMGSEFGIQIHSGSTSPSSQQSLTYHAKDAMQVSSDDPSLRGEEENDSIKIAWLMSFPNSGTSYTSELIRTVTGHNTASNYYGVENLGTSGISTPVFEDSPKGPFWTDPSNPTYSKPKRGYVLTKTHCGGRCDRCGPSDYIENHELFLKQCLEAEYVDSDGNGGTKKTKGIYDKDLIERAVHLIRDPFDNIVSRFHLAHNHFGKRNETDKVEKYPKSSYGFRKFCSDLGETYQHEEKKSRLYSDVYQVVKDIPCHADFFKFVQWHNLAFTTTWDLGVPTLVLHYENYTSNFNQTKEMLLDFLKQDDNHYDPPEFITGKTYREYFTKKEVDAVSQMFSKLALDKTWNYTKHYFD